METEAKCKTTPTEFLYGWEFGDFLNGLSRSGYLDRGSQAGVCMVT